MNKSIRMIAMMFVGLILYTAESFSVEPNVLYKTADKPLFRDPVHDGAADPVLCWNRSEKKWFMFYTNRRANLPNMPGVSWVHGTQIGIAESCDGGASWKYRGTADIDYGDGEFSYWAPDVIYNNGFYHMFLTFVPGMHADWGGRRDIIHLTSTDLLEWKYQSTLKLSSDRCIDACVIRLKDGTWRMWYNNEVDRKSIYYADSTDLFTWNDRGKVIGDQPGEGPKVFRWKDRYWMVVDVWQGLGIYSSDDGVNWTRQKKNLLEEPGSGPDDKVKGGHPDVVVSNDRAYLFYFTHPGRTPDAAGKDTYQQRRSSIQVVQLQYTDGQIMCDRDKPTYINLLQPDNEEKVSDYALSWPEITFQCRPWTRWWWLGSAVDKDNLGRLLKEYQKAGFGGVEICPIYGAKGFEESFIDFLSPKWMDMLEHTIDTAEKLNIGVDLTTGTGWPFGGPWVSDDIASAKVILENYTLTGGEEFKSSLPEGRLEYMVAVSEDGGQIDLTEKVVDGRLNWIAPPGKWKLYALLQKSPIQKVKRAAPGGEGNVLDPFSVNAMDRYLAKFDKAFADYTGKMPRSHFHDSYEYYGACWTKDFLQKFESLRGYDLRTELQTLSGDGYEDNVMRVQSDYRKTLSDLHLAYIQRWNNWCHENGSFSRNQAHGAPGNLLDIYAAADIPETEIFGQLHESKIPLMKFSSSAANVTGKTLASAESFTWLGEHFQVSLSEVKQAADFLFTTGVNHILFHGVPYSPTDIPWPGWQFYAAVNFGPDGGLWQDLPQFNAYVARCQSVLQSGKPANDVLLYFPVHDYWHKQGDLLIRFDTHHLQEDWVKSSPFYKTAITLQQRGYTYDHISDTMLADARCKNGKMLLGGNVYQAIIVPQCQLIPLETMEKLSALAAMGTTVIFKKSLPCDVPGFGDLQRRRSKFQQLITRVKQEDRVIVTEKIEAALDNSGIVRESCVDNGLRFVKRSHPQGYHYFLVNQGENKFEGWIKLAAPAKSAVIMAPLFDNKAGLAKLRQGDDGFAQVYLQLHPKESCILRTFNSKMVTGPVWPYFQPAGSPQNIEGTWKVKFIDGGPELPKGFETPKLSSWTVRDDAEARRFAGTASYTIEFNYSPDNADDWLLSLGKVCESAKIILNGEDVGVLWCEPFQIPAGRFLRSGKNTLTVEVSNLAANRIRDLDKRKVNWKYFYDINLVDKNYKPFDASGWPLRDSGLLGPVLLKPVKIAAPAAD